MIGGGGAGQDDAPPSHSVPPQALTTQSITEYPMSTRQAEREKERPNTPPRIPTQAMDTRQTMHTAIRKGDYINHSGSMLHLCIPDPHTITHVLLREREPRDTMREVTHNRKSYVHKLQLPNLPKCLTTTIIASPTDNNAKSTPKIKFAPSLRLRGAGPHDTPSTPSPPHASPAFLSPQSLASHVAAQVAAGIAARHKLNPNAPTFLPTPPTASNKRHTFLAKSYGGC